MSLGSNQPVVISRKPHKNTPERVTIARSAQIWSVSNLAKLTRNIP